VFVIFQLGNKKHGTLIEIMNCDCLCTALHLAYKSAVQNTRGVLQPQPCTYNHLQMHLPTSQQCKNKTSSSALSLITIIISFAAAWQQVKTAALDLSWAHPFDCSSPSLAAKPQLFSLQAPGGCC
jgi:hypothetical protein